LISFWEKEQNHQEFDVTIIGAGFTGLFSAWFILKANPNAKIAICDSAFPPPAASTRNAGFACFGSPTEILEDLSKESEASVLERIEMRFNGLEDLKSICGKSEINYTEFGGFEIFSPSENTLFENTVNELSKLNSLLKPYTGGETFTVSDHAQHSFKNAIKINFEGQLNPFLAWKQLYSKVASTSNVHFISSKALDLEPVNDGVSVKTEKGIITSHKVIVATNGFTKRLLPKTNIVPARAQVLITSPIENLKLKGSFHKDRGFVYFRNVGNRVLIGGYRNLDVETEETDAFELNKTIQESLKTLLKNEILPDHSFNIEHRWAGIMGFGENQEKDFLLEEPLPNVILAVRLGGMGVAISSALAKKAVKKMG
jgi:glycine/D-amino acid oxidase-like deaminating enzyme